MINMLTLVEESKIIRNIMDNEPEMLLEHLERNNDLNLKIKYFGDVNIPINRIRDIYENKKLEKTLAPSLRNKIHYSEDDDKYFLEIHINPESVEVMNKNISTLMQISPTIIEG